jgi:hypothetical protein
MHFKKDAQHFRFSGKASNQCGLTERIILNLWAHSHLSAVLHSILEHPDNDHTITAFNRSISLTVSSHCTFQ